MNKRYPIVKSILDSAHYSYSCVWGAAEDECNTHSSSYAYLEFAMRTHSIFTVIERAFRRSQPQSIY